MFIYQYFQHIRLSQVVDAFFTEEGAYPDMQIVWSSKDHATSVVPLLVQGPGANYFADVQRNWQIGTHLKSIIRKN
ncbi:hypothetical protein [Ekhidna sp.]